MRAGECTGWAVCGSWSGLGGYRSLFGSSWFLHARGASRNPKPKRAMSCFNQPRGTRSHSTTCKSELPAHTALRDATPCRFDALTRTVLTNLGLLWLPTQLCTGAWHHAWATAGQARPSQVPLLHVYVQVPGVHPPRHRRCAHDVRRRKDGASAPARHDKRVRTGVDDVH